MGEDIESYLGYLAEREGSRQGLRAARQDLEALRKFLRKHGVEVTSEVTELHVLAWSTVCQKALQRPRFRLERTRDFLAYLQRRRRAAKGLADLVPDVSDVSFRSDHPILASAQVRDMIRALPPTREGARAKAIVYLAWEAGAGARQVHEMDLRDVRPDQRAIDLRSRGARRRADVSHHAMAALTKWISVREHESPELTKPDPKALFINFRTGARLTEMSVRTDVAEAGKAIDLAVTPTMLWKTRLVELARRGATPEELAEFAGRSEFTVREILRTHDVTPS